MLASVELQDRAYQSIRRKILEGRVRTRKDLARRVLQAELGVSSTCIQVALARLEGEGLLESRPQSGTFLRRSISRSTATSTSCASASSRTQRGARPATSPPHQVKRLSQSCDDYAALEVLEDGLRVDL